jgi:hypothetical protein
MGKHANQAVMQEIERQERRQHREREDERTERERDYDEWRWARLEAEVRNMGSFQ